MKYVYPKLSEHDLGFIRLGGAGLGNILFAYARAEVYARDTGCSVIWPTWASLKLGPYLRREKDKRFYGDLFQNREGAVDGLYKLYLLLTSRKVKEKDRDSAAEGGAKNTVIEFTGFDGCFEEILYDYAYIRERIILNLRDKNRRALEKNWGAAVGIHVRLGDFTRASEEEVRQGRHDSSLPIEWYVKILQQIREYAGFEVPAYVFSDGEDAELAPLCDLEQVERVTFGTSIGDILALSRFPLLIASGSSFSMWARYLGRNSCICYQNQRKQQILTKEEDAFEYETDGQLAPEIGEKIRKIFAGSAR